MNAATIDLRRPRAFTLVEMVTSCLILSMTMLALGYGLKTALVSTGTGAANAAASLDAADVVERVSDDLNEAISFSERSATAVTFTVPDRGTDGNPDKIRYQWWPTAGNIVIPGSGGGGGGGGGGSSGGGGGLLGALGGLLGGLLGGGGTPSGNGDTLIPVPAYTLTRQVNDGDTSVVARDVRNFDLRYAYRTMNGNTAGVTSNNDRLLWEYDTPALIGIPGTYDISNSRFMGQTFLASSNLPAGTTSWTPTRIQVQLRADGECKSLMRCSIRRVSTNILQPNWPLSGAANILETSAPVAEVSLNDVHGWAEFRFSGNTNLNPATKFAFVVEGFYGGGTYSNASFVQAGIPIPAGTWLVQTTTGTNASPTWATSSLNSMRYRIYGRTTP